MGANHALYDDVQKDIVAFFEKRRGTFISTAEAHVLLKPYVGQRLSVSARDTASRLIKLHRGRVIERRTTPDGSMWGIAR